MSNNLSPNLQSLIFNHILALADDELVIGHRASEWTGLGPILEEDIAFSSIAQDELGHALTFYTLLEGLGGGDSDDLAFLRGPSEFRNAQLCELPRGDFAFSLVRHFLYDLAEAVRLDRLADSTYAPLAQAAAKIRQEEKYHLMHGRTWVQKLARGGDEAHGRLQAALDLAYPTAAGLFEPGEGEAELVAAGLVPPSAEIEAGWREVVVPFLHSAGFTVPIGKSHLGGRHGEHTEHLVQLLDAMQALYRADPEASW